MKAFASIAVCALLAACGQESPATKDDAGPTPPIATTTASEAAAERFRYTRLDDCALIRSAPEEAGFYEHECEGAGGYRLRLSESDLRENVVVLAPDAGEHSLELSKLAGGAFNTVGDRAEWRADQDGGGFVPEALILRQSVMEDPDPAVPEVSYLVVARLAPTPCVIARVPPGPGQNARARVLADAGGDCLPG